MLQGKHDMPDNHPSETDLIRRITAGLSSSPEVVTGIGDDAAVLRLADPGEDLVLTTDAVITGVHVTPDTPPEAIGRKAAGRVLSDFAAMGARPVCLLFNVVFPDTSDAARLESIYRGAEQLASRYHCPIVGGDVARGPAEEVHGFGVGAAPKGRAVLRRGARSGDVIYVSGELGGSIHGHHLTFEPRIREGRWLREQGWPTAMMDISDGLATDLRHIMTAGEVGAVVESGHLPVRSGVRGTWTEDEAVQHALCDGEDYELLFTIPEPKADAFEAAWAETQSIPCTRIGFIDHRTGNLHLRHPDGTEELFPHRGYDHGRRDG